MVFRRMGFAKRPINSTKHVIDFSTAVAGLANTQLGPNSTGHGPALVRAAEDASQVQLSNEEIVPDGSRVSSVYLSIFVCGDVNEAAPSAIPLVDWYIIYDKGGQLTTFDASGMPTPGATGTHRNKSKILHEEKGIVGEKNDGSKMVFQGVIRIPRGQQRFTRVDGLKIAFRSNFDTVLCLKAIYKSYQ